MPHGVGKMKNRKHLWIFTISIVVLIIPIIICVYINTPAIRNDDEQIPCPPLPNGFSEPDLVGTWIADYFGNKDVLIITADKKYKQQFSSYSNKSLDFETDWQEWRVEYTSNGYALLHLDGMRKCDGSVAVCEDPNGGLPDGDIVMDVCAGGAMTYSDEVILFVTGSYSETPRSIVLRQAQDASDWKFIFKIQEP